MGVDHDGGERQLPFACHRLDVVGDRRGRFVVAEQSGRLDPPGEMAKLFHLQAVMPHIGANAVLKTGLSLVAEISNSTGNDDVVDVALARKRDVHGKIEYRKSLSGSAGPHKQRAVVGRYQ